MNLFQLILLALLASLLVTAIVTDLRSRTIGNWLNLAVALLAIGWWIASRMSPSEIGIHIAGAAVMLILFGAAFAFGAMGGGDVKLITALGLWLSPSLLAKMLIVMSLGGGLLTLIAIAVKFARRAEGRIEVPYGVAISGAAIFVVANDILTIGRP